MHASESESVSSLAENGRITVLETSDRASLAPHRVQQHHAIRTQDRSVAKSSHFNHLNRRKQFDRDTCSPVIAHQSSLTPSCFNILSEHKEDSGQNHQITNEGGQQDDAA